jgi:hypothetical protein
MRRRASAAQPAPPDGASVLRCAYCLRDIARVPRVRCAECPGRVSTCLDCFSVGAALHPHQASHDYVVVEEVCAPAFEDGWAAAEEVSLLDALAVFGLANWKAVAERVGSKSAAKCEGHYKRVYLNSRTAPLPDGFNVLPAEDAAPVTEKSGQRKGAALVTNDAPGTARTPVSRSRAAARPKRNQEVRRKPRRVIIIDDDEDEEECRHVAEDADYRAESEDVVVVGDDEVDNEDGEVDNEDGEADNHDDDEELGEYDLGDDDPDLEEGEPVDINTNFVHVASSREAPRLRRQQRAASAAARMRLSGACGTKDDNGSSESEDTDGEKEPASASEDGEEPVCPQSGTVSGYMAKRGDFDVEWDDDAENILADMAFADDDTPEEYGLKLRLIQIYNERLAERERVKSFVLSRGVLDFEELRRHAASIPADQKELASWLSRFQRLLPVDLYSAFERDVLAEDRVSQEIQRLARYRALGIRTMAQVHQYEVDATNRILNLGLEHPPSQPAPPPFPLTKASALDAAATGVANVAVRQTPVFRELPRALVPSDPLNALDTGQSLAQSEREICAALRLSRTIFAEIRSTLLAATDAAGYGGNPVENPDTVVAVYVSGSASHESIPPTAEGNGKVQGNGAGSSSSPSSSSLRLPNTENYIHISTASVSDPRASDSFPSAFAAKVSFLTRREAEVKGFASVLMQDPTLKSLPYYPPQTALYNLQTGVSVDVPSRINVGYGDPEFSRSADSDSGIVLRLRITSPLPADAENAHFRTQFGAKKPSDRALAAAASAKRASPSVKPSEPKTQKVSTERSEMALLTANESTNPVVGLSTAPTPETELPASVGRSGGPSLVTSAHARPELTAGADCKKQKRDDASNPAPREQQSNVKGLRATRPGTDEVVPLPEILRLVSKSSSSKSSSPDSRPSRTARKDDDSPPPAISARSLRSNDKKYEFRVR